jgi:hypothetical protein
LPPHGTPGFDRPQLFRRSIPEGKNLDKYTEEVCHHSEHLDLTGHSYSGDKYQKVKTWINILRKFATTRNSWF